MKRPIFDNFYQIGIIPVLEIVPVDRTVPRLPRNNRRWQMGNLMKSLVWQKKPATL